MKYFIFTVCFCAIFGLPFTIKAVSPSEISDYERYYPQFVDSKESLSKLRFNDSQSIKADAETLKKYMKDIVNSKFLIPTTIPYGPDDKQQLDIYHRPDEKDQLHPVIFFIHAGFEDKATVVHAVPIWLPLGYTVVSINHRSVPKNSFAEMIQDCNMALKWVMEHIQKYGGDPNRIAITGLSCGAHLAAVLVTNQEAHQKYHIDISKVKCWFPMSGFYDMDLKENYISPNIKGYLEMICTPSKYAASPVAQVTGKEPPSLIIHGADDWCVPRTNALALHNRLKQAGATTQLAVLKGYLHANIFYSYLQPDHEPAKRIKRFLATYLPTPKNHKSILDIFSKE